MKAVSQLIGGALLIAIVLTTASILMQWTTIFSEKETEEIKTETEHELRCQYAELYISNVTYDCNIFCEGSVGAYCNGFPFNCIVHNESIQNCTIADCTWLPAGCGGTPFSCIKHNQSQTNCTIADCTWDPAHCGGTPNVCSSYGTQSPCQDADCTWNPSSCSNNGNCDSSGTCASCPGCSGGSGGTCSNKPGGSCTSCSGQSSCINCLSASCVWDTGSRKVFNDGFETGASWTNFTETSGTGWQNVLNAACGGATSCYDGSRCACAENGATNVLVQTTAIALTSYSDCILSWAIWIDSSFDAGEYAYVDVQNSTNGWKNIFSCTNGQACENNAWTVYTYNITSGIGLNNNFKVRFQAVGNDANEELLVDAVNITCLGTASCSGNLDCSAYTSEGACTTCSQCQWTPSTSCTGTLNCPTFNSNQASCQACNQCSWTPGSCSGTPSSCSTYLLQSTCAPKGCTWYPNNCTGTPGICGNHISSQTNCTTSGCSWNSQNCTGTPGNCGAHNSSESDCATSGCTWVPGEPGSCTEADHHNITYNISNLGSITFSIDEILIRNTTGYLFIYNISEAAITPGNTTNIIAENTNKKLNHTIQEIIIASKNCPKTARDIYPGDYINYVNC